MNYYQRKDLKESLETFPTLRNKDVCMYENTVETALTTYFGEAKTS